MNRLTKLAGIALLAGAATIGCGGKTESIPKADLKNAAFKNSWHSLESKFGEVTISEALIPEIMSEMYRGEAVRTDSKDLESWYEQIVHTKNQFPQKEGHWREYVVESFSKEIDIEYWDRAPAGPSTHDALFIEETIFATTWDHGVEKETVLTQKRKFSVGYDLRGGARVELANPFPEMDQDISLFRNPMLRDTYRGLLGEKEVKE